MDEVQSDCITPEDCQGEGINPEYARARAERRRFDAWIAEINRDVAAHGDERVTSWWTKEMGRLKARHAKDWQW